MNLDVFDKNIVAETGISNKKLTVYFDGSCPLCLKEIGFYRRQAGSEHIAWQDVSDPTSGDLPAGLSCEAAMARFHVKRQDGTVIDGGSAFVEIWKQLPAFKWLGIFGSLRISKWILNRAYNAFLPIRPYLQRLFG
ncbi:MAG: DUF393 domain-containing protein [Pseudomonadota bacterium]